MATNIEASDSLESESAGHNRLKNKTGVALSTIGWLVIGFNLNSIIFNSFPLKLLVTDWQLNFITQILSTSTSILFGATLVALGRVLNPRDKVLKDWSASMTRFASIFAALLIFCIPIQFYLGFKALKDHNNANTEVVNKLKSLAKSIRGTETEADYRLFLTTLPNPPELPDKLNAPFPILKQQVLENLQSQINAATETVKTEKSNALQLFLKEVIRNSSQSILIAAGFSALAGLSSKADNPVTKFFQSVM